MSAHRKDLRDRLVEAEQALVDALRIVREVIGPTGAAREPLRKRRPLPGRFRCSICHRKGHTSATHAKRYPPKAISNS